MVTATGKQPSRPRKPARSKPGPSGHKAAVKHDRAAKLSAADITELAGQMRMPEGILRLVLARYPELARPLARHRDLAA
jgi:acyl-CoA reductase-like NAD-dependent aldehyde dehydrogenase